MPQGLFHQHASEEYITAITKTTLLAISTNHLRKVMVSFPQAADVVILIMEESLRQGQHRETMLHIPAAKDRYAFLAQHEPYILK